MMRAHNRRIVMSRDLAIGKHLTALRESARLKQNELAKKLEWSAAVLSRVESGERPLTDDELEIIIRGIGTDEAFKLKERLNRSCQILPEPPLDDPAADLLSQPHHPQQTIHPLPDQPNV